MSASARQLALGLPASDAALYAAWARQSAWARAAVPFAQALASPAIRRALELTTQHLAAPTRRSRCRKV